MTRIVWTQRQDIGPSGRSNAGFAFDAKRSRTVLFGGYHASVQQGDTWEWDGAHWTQVQDTGPAARGTVAMAYGDAGVVLFGGRGLTEFLSDTWSWDGADWTQLADTGPSARARTSLVYDGEQYVLFGGEGAGVLLGDTWTFDGSEWTQVADTGPSPRQGHAMSYDAARKRVILFGGGGGTTGTDLEGDTWLWDGNDWTQVEDAGPPARLDAPMTADAASVWLFGGGSSYSTGADLFGDSWEWDGSQWTQRQDIGPSPRMGAGMAFDSQRDRVVLFGGLDRGATSHSEEFVGDTWEARTVSPPPPPPPAATFTVDGSMALVDGSDIGFVSVTTPTAPSADVPISVSVAGVPDDLNASIMFAGATTTLAYFSLGTRPTGPLSVDVTMAGSTVSAMVQVVGGVVLGDLGFMPSAVAVGGMMGVTCVLLSLATPQMVSILSLTTGALVGQFTIPANTAGLAQGTVTVDSSVAKGQHRFVAMASEASGSSVAGPVDVTIL